MDYFKLMCYIFVVWDFAILVVLGVILVVAIKALNILKAMNARHQNEFLLQYDIYQELRQIVPAIGEEK